MKFLTLFAAGIAVTPALASSTAVKRDISAIVADISAIQSATAALDTAVKGFSGAGDAAGILSAVQAVNSAITKGTSDAKSTSQLSVTDATMLVTPVQNLGDAVSTAIDDTIAKKSAFVSAGLGGEVETQLKGIQSNSNSLIAAIEAIVPPSLKSTAQMLAAPITAALQKGVDAFANTGGSTSSASGSSASSSATSASSGGSSMSTPMSSAASSTSSAAASSGSFPPSSTPSASSMAPSGSSAPPSASSPVPYMGSANTLAAGFGGVAAAAAAVAVFAL